METINPLELRDKNTYPDDAVLKPILNKSFPAYKQLLELFKRNEMFYESTTTAKGRGLDEWAKAHERQRGACRLKLPTCPTATGRGLYLGNPPLELAQAMLWWQVMALL